jgi:tartrate-resistant acid phosphatase type 5
LKVDPLIAERFENIYANKYESLKDKTWLVSLGNHDWRKDPWAQVAYGNRYNEKWVMPDLFWKKELLIENKYHVQLIFLDTTRFHDGHRRDYPQVGRQSKQGLKKINQLF